MYLQRTYKVAQKSGPASFIANKSPRPNYVKVGQLVQCCMLNVFV